MAGRELHPISPSIARAGQTSRRPPIANDPFFLGFLTFTQFVASPVRKFSRCGLKQYMVVGTDDVRRGNCFDIFEGQCKGYFVKYWLGFRKWSDWGGMMKEIWFQGINNVCDCRREMNVWMRGADLWALSWNGSKSRLKPYFHKICKSGRSSVKLTKQKLYAVKGNVRQEINLLKFVRREINILIIMLICALLISRFLR